jgi:hypothetical protein
MADRETFNRLHEFTKGCRDDMHEPDEQRLDAEFGPQFRFTGDGPMKISLDNACVPNPGYKKTFSLEMERMDMGFWLLREDEDGKTRREWFNLADVIALARKAQF